MSDLMNKAPTASEQMDKALAASVAKLKPMVQVKAYVDILVMLAAQPSGYDVDFDNFDQGALAELQDYNSSRLDRREMITDAIHNMVRAREYPDSVEYDNTELSATFLNTVTEISNFAVENPQISYLDAAIQVCKKAISKEISLKNSDRKVTENRSEFWGNTTTYEYTSVASLFNRDFKVNAKIIKSCELRVEINVTSLEDVKYGENKYFIDEYLKEVVTDYCYAWVNILHRISEK